MLSFFHRGRLIRSVGLDHLVRTPKGLSRTASHVRWCEAMTLDGNNRFKVRTGAGTELIFDITTGRAVTSGRPAPAGAPLFEDR
jgi:hypothetical protein